MQHSNCYSNVKNTDHSKCFDPTTTNDAEDFVRKLEEPRLIPMGR